MTPLQECTVPAVSQFELTGNKALDILWRIFHLHDFRGCQRAVPALMMQKVTIVVFPLLALLLDQVERMRLIGSNVWYLR